MAEELKAGGKGWKTRKRQQRALEKLSIVLARENGADRPRHLVAAGSRDAPVGAHYET